MARIPDSELARLKSEISLQRLVEDSGIELKRHGADLLGLCPFHDDHEPSLVISPAKNLWHCLGACQTGGSVIDWVIKAKGVSFRHAVELLREGLPLLVAKPVKRTSVRELPAPIQLASDDQQLLDETLAYYHERLKTTPEALNYLQSRGLDHPELIERFRLGFADRTLGLRLPEKTRKDGADIRARLQNIGLLRETGHEHFNGSLVIPILDASGHAVEVYGRKIGDRLKPGIPKHLYLPGPHRGIWNLEALQQHKEIILCEALIDALTFWNAGYRNVTASYGIEGFTAEHLAAFGQYATERVLIAYDRDAAGDAATESLAATLAAVGVDCYRIQFPRGMDANEYALKVTPAVKSLGLAIRKAVWLGKGAAPAAKAEAPAPVATKAEAPVAEPPFLAATPAPPLPAPEIPEINDNEIILTLGERRYRVRGLAKNLSFEVMKINLLASRGEAFHIDTLDLYAARARAAYIAQAAIELGLPDDVIKNDLGRVLLCCEEQQEAHIKKALEPKPIESVQMSDPERQAALALLSSPDLSARILADLDACGLVGEHTNKLVGYLAATSRLLDAPLAVVVRSSSAAGKSSLMDAVLNLMPEEERIKYSAMTGQSLFYMGETNLKHKILALAEEEGASRASYALKLLQSEGELTMASTGKDPTTGNLVTQEYRVEGPVMLFTTTTAADIDPELRLVLSVDEGREQTRAIHRLQREKRTLEGLLACQERHHLMTLHRNAQRLLKPLFVLNPHARELTFPDSATRLRRSHEHYLTLIDTLALLHQHQRPIHKTRHRGQEIEYIEVTLADIETANALAHEVLGRSLDELPPQTRGLLRQLSALVNDWAITQAIPRASVRFNRRQAREALNLSDTQLRLHLERLVELEYVLARRDGPGGKFVYELAYDGAGEDGQPFVPGLIDVAALRAGATAPNSRGMEAELAPDSRGERGPFAPCLRDNESPLESILSAIPAELSETRPKTQCSAIDQKTAPYPQRAPQPLAAHA